MNPNQLPPGATLNPPTAQEGSSLSPNPQLTQSQLPPGATLNQSSPSVAPTNPSDGSPNNPGWFQSAVQTIAEPFKNMYATVANGVLGGVNLVAQGANALDNNAPDTEALANNTQQAMNNLSEGKVQLPYLGTATPWTAPMEDPTNTSSAPQKLLQVTGGVVGDGLQIASYFLGDAGAATGVVKGAGGTVLTDAAGVGAEALRSSFMKGVMKFVGTALPFSLLQGMGSAISQDVATGKDTTGGQTAIDATLNTAGNVAGFAVMAGASGLLRQFGMMMMKNPLVQKANAYMVDSISKMFSVDPQLGLAGTNDAMTRSLTALQSQVMAGQHKVVDAVANTLDTKADTSSLWSSIQAKFTPYIQSLFSARDAAFKDLGVANPTIKGGFSSVMDIIGKAQDYLGRVNKDLTPPSNNAAFQGLSPDDLRDVTASMGGKNTPSAESGLSNFINDVQSVIGNDGKNSVPLQTIQALMDKADLVPTTGDAAHGFVNSIQKMLQEDSLTSLRSDPTTAPIADKWEQALQQNTNVKSFTSGPVAGAIKAGTNVPDFVNSLFTGAAPSAQDAQKIVQGLGGAGSEALTNLSELIKNNLINTARYANSDYSVGAKTIQDFVNKWQSSGILTNEDINTVGDFSQLMGNKYSDIVDGVRGMIGDANPDILSQAADLQAKTNSAQQLQTLTKNLGGNDMFSQNKDGTYNMKNAIDALTKSNVNGQYDEVLGQLNKLNPEKASVSNLRTVVMAAGKIGLGGLAMTHLPLIGGHSIAGYIAIGTAAEDISKLMGWKGVDAASKLTADDVTKWLGTLANQTGKDGKPILSNSFYSNLISGKFDNAFSLVAKGLGVTFGNQTAKAKDGLTDDGQ